MTRSDQSQANLTVKQYFRVHLQASGVSAAPRDELRGWVHMTNGGNGVDTFSLQSFEVFTKGDITVTKKELDVPPARLPQDGSVNQSITIPIRTDGPGARIEVRLFFQSDGSGALGDAPIVKAVSLVWNVEHPSVEEAFQETTGVDLGSLLATIIIVVVLAVSLRLRKKSLWRLLRR